MDTAWIDSEEVVENSLEIIQELLREDAQNLWIIAKRTGVVDKTFNYMSEKNLNPEIIRDYILNLNVTNYSYTDLDRNMAFGGEFKLFGAYIPELQDEVYIKLKIKKKVICMSFHEKEFPITYPYL